jgi:hypothetical protein
MCQTGMSESSSRSHLRSYQAKGYICRSTRYVLPHRRQIQMRVALSPSALGLENDQHIWEHSAGSESKTLPMVLLG